MKEDVAQWGNLFKSKTKGGAGADPSGDMPTKEGQPDFKNWTQAQYKKWKETNASH